MKRTALGIVAGLTLLVASASATLAPNEQMIPANAISFRTYMTPVTDPNTPGWARLNDVIAWWELILGTVDRGDSTMTIYLRGGVKELSGQTGWEQWIAVGPILGPVQSDPTAGNPEPGTWLFAAAVIAAIWLRRRSQIRKQRLL